MFHAEHLLDKNFGVEKVNGRQGGVNRSILQYLHACHFLAWKKGLKTLYYCRSEKLAKADKVSKRIERDVIKELDMTQIAQGNECLACEG